MPLLGIGFGSFNDTVPAQLSVTAASGPSATAFSYSRIDLACGAVSGLTGPLTYQWHRSTTIGFSASSASVIAGATALTVSDTGRSSSTQYYYILVVTGVEASVALAQVTATTLSNANEPSGMTPYTIQDGSTKDWGVDWAAAGSGAKWANNTYVEVVADATNPTGSGSAIEYRFLAGTVMSDYRHIYTHGGGSDSLTDLYIRLRFKYSDNYQISTALAPTRSAGKVFGYWGHSGDRSSYFIDNRDATPHTFPHKIAYGDQPPGVVGPNYISSGTVAPIQAGPAWNLMEIHHKAQSAVGAGDGELKVWVDGVLVMNGAITEPSDPDPQYTPLLSTKMEFGPMRGHDNADPREPLEETDYIRIGEFYMSGKE